MTETINPTPGSIVTSRDRQWVVIPSENQEVVRLRSLSGNEDEIVGIYQKLWEEGLETIEPATFPLPKSEQVKDHSAALLLMDAALENPLKETVLRALIFTFPAFPFPAVPAIS
ncbi:hypothetical protein [Scytonema sp. NUACC26]|uniref:hypothetical protein n=1 Tax=Scytonema sp. NUACC26 TaxID=3140176 RepID=UPI0034DBCD43